MKKFLITLICLSALSACSNDIKNSLGLRKEAPDEFTVISYPPLTVPPSFNLESPMVDTNAQALYHPNAINSNALSAEEKSLLHKARSSSEHKTQTGHQLDQDWNKKEHNKSKKGAIRSAIESLNSGEGDLVIDPQKERERIDANIQSSKSINEGDIGTRNQKSTLDRILGN